MTNSIKSFSTLFLAAVILTMGTGLLNSLLSMNMSLQGYSERVIGLVMSGNYAGVILGIFFCLPIVKRVGHIRAFATFAAIVTVIALLYSMYLSAFFWFLLRILNGLCGTGLFMVLESWLNEKTEGSGLLHYARWQREEDFRAFAEKAQGHPDLPAIREFTPSATFYRSIRQFKGG